MKPSPETTNLITAGPVNLLTEPLPLKRIQGSRSRFKGIDAVVDPDTREILRTYDPETSELLLAFPPGAIPGDFERHYSDVYFVRDFNMEFSHKGTPSSALACAEKMAAFAVMRDFAGLPLRALFLGDTRGFCDASGRFLSAEHALLMALAGVAWSARNGVMPTVAELEIPERILSEDVNVDRLPGWKAMPVQEIFKWWMSEAVKVLNRHSKFIRMVGRELSCYRIISGKELEMFLNNRPYIIGGEDGYSAISSPFMDGDS